jgi:hypothetical protein
MTAYNQVILDGGPTLSSAEIAYRMGRAQGVRSPHMALLNCFASLGTPRDARFAARVFLLERNLRQLIKSGIQPTTFRSMFRTQGGLEQLVAETSVAARCRVLGELGAHDPSGSGNYDVMLKNDRGVLRGDVKFFTTWVMKREAETDLLATIEMLLKPELNHLVEVAYQERPMSDSMAVEAALEVQFLYSAAQDWFASPGGQDPDVVVSLDPDRRVVASRAVTQARRNGVAGVKTVGYLPANVGGGGVMTIGSKVGDAWEDAESVRANLFKAAQQVPASTGEDLAVAFVGSANYQDVEEVEVALCGAPGTQGEGLFREDSGERLDKLDAVVWFSLNYEFTPRSPVPLIRATRSARFFVREGKELTRSQRDQLEAVCAVVGRDSLVRVVYAQ